MQCAIRHPEKVRKVVSISAAFRQDGWVKEALDMVPQLTSEIFKGTPVETGYKELSPTPDEFPNFVKRVFAMAVKPFDFGADKLKATKAPSFSSTAMPTAFGSSTSRKCSASRATRFSATCVHAQHRDWPSCPTRHTSR